MAPGIQLRSRLQGLCSAGAGGPMASVVLSVQPPSSLLRCKTWLGYTAVRWVALRSCLVYGHFAAAVRKLLWSLPLTFEA